MGDTVYLIELIQEVLTMSNKIVLAALQRQTQ